MAAKITTVGEQAEDFFMVTNDRYEALSEQERQQLQAAIIAELDS